MSFQMTRRSLATLPRSSDELIRKLEWFEGATCEEAVDKRYARRKFRETTSQSQALKSTKSSTRVSKCKSALGGCFGMRLV